MKHRGTVPTGQRRPLFNHEWRAVTFRTDTDELVFLDFCKYELEHKLLRENGQFLLSAADFQKIYAPDLKLRTDGDAIHLEFENYIQYIDLTDPTMAICKDRQIIGGIPYLPVTDILECSLEAGKLEIKTEEGTKKLSACPRYVEDILYLPAVEILEKAFGASVQVFHEGAERTFWAKPVCVRDTVCVSFDPSFRLTGDYAGVLTRAMTKACGDIYETYWFEAGNRIMPYRLYIPFAYRAGTPHKALVTYPGGLANENSYYNRIPHGGFQRTAEKHDFMIVGLTGYGVSTFFGSMIPILQTLDGIDAAQANPDNPEDWPEETLRLRRLAEKGMWEALRVIEQRWSIDRKNLFAMGNSAGSDTTMYYFLKFPGLFKAAVPTGGFINYNFADMSGIKPDTMLHIIGTEDEHGFNDMIRAYAELDRLGVQYRKRIVGGGNHAQAWTFAVDEIFNFLDEKARQ